MFFENIPILTKADFFELSFMRHAKVSVLGRPYHALSFRKSGKIEISACGSTYLSEPGTLTYIPRAFAYETTTLESGEMMFIHFTMKDDSPSAPFVIAPHSSSRFKELFREGLSSTKNPLIAMSLCYRIFAELAAELMPKEDRPPRRMLKAKEYLDSHICDTDLKVSHLANIAGVSEVYFRSEFKRYYRSSPIEYIKSERIKLAKDLLVTGICSVSDVATSSGFDSISYFSQEFRRLVGVSPTQYKKYN